MAYLVFVLTVIGPIVFWLWYVRRQDTSEPEPRYLMRRCIYVGMAAGIAAGIFEILFYKTFGFPSNILEYDSVAPFALTALAVLFVGPIEELSKYIVLRSSVYFSHDFNQIFDGIIYGITIALGFSFIENIFYFIDFYSHYSRTELVVHSSMRGLFSTFAHVTFTSILGYYVGKAKFSNGNRTWLIVQGLVYASVLHSLYDLLLLSSLKYALLWGTAMNIIAFLFFKRLWNTSEVRMIWKYTPPAPTNVPAPQSPIL